LPAFPASSKSIKTFAFCESEQTFTNWNKSPEKCGIFAFRRLKSNESLGIVTSFKSTDGSSIVTNRWGRAVAEDTGLEQCGIWLRFDKIPVFSPWHAPNSWDDLRLLCGEQLGLDIDGHIRSLLPTLRQSSIRLLALGFPVPSLVGQNAERIHWQAFEVQNICDGRSRINGFQNNEKGFWQRDRAVALQGKSPLPWADSQNWAVDQLQTRGSLSDPVARKSFLLIGAGAVGSVIAELLVRAGVHRFHVLDTDSLRAGNLVRHTLLLPNVSHRKSDALADRLNNCSPHAQVEAINDLFPPRTAIGRDKIGSCDVIIDCTADDDVLWDLSKNEWPSPKWMFSVSTGFGVKRLFLFSSHERIFPATAFRSAINPWLIDEADNYQDGSFPREGIGCWHPVFPGRIDDLWTFAGLAVKEFTSLIEKGILDTQLVVFERKADVNGCSTISKVKEVPCLT
jgi:hypothetical protein